MSLKSLIIKIFEPRLNPMKKSYSNKDITVHWKPDVCIHSKNCWKGLIGVFDPRKKPWINMEGASTEEIIAQVNKCPSGALSFCQNINMEKEKSGQQEPVEVNIAYHKSIKIKGNFVVKDREGNIIMEGKNYVSLCSCVHTKTWPLCDNSHRDLPENQNDQKK